MTDATQHAQPTREGQHTMTEFKPGNRVQWRDKDGILQRGTVDDVSDDGVYGTWDGGGRFVAGPWDLTKIDDGPKPLRFEDVRDGDTITVEGEDYTITGTAWTEPGDPPRVTVGGVTVFNFNGDEGTHGPYGPPVRLTAHTPAGPAPAEQEKNDALAAQPAVTDPAPLRFEDVRTGDTITVEVKYADGTDATFSGVVASVGGVRRRRRVRIGQLPTFYENGPNWQVIAPLGNVAALTAHEPAEPEWHRAKVIKADADYGDGDPETGRLPTQRHGGVFLASTRVPGEFLDQAGNELTPDAFTNVTVIVDEHGQVRA